LDENFSRLITTFDEVPLVAFGDTSLLVTRHSSDASPRQPSVDLKRRPPKSRPGLIPRKLAPARKAAREDSAVHVSLSSDSLVKQPEPLTHSTR
jgi:hypothetical protein